MSIQTFRHQLLVRPATAIGQEVEGVGVFGAEVARLPYSRPSRPADGMALFDQRMHERAGLGMRLPPHQHVAGPDMP